MHITKILRDVLICEGQHGQTWNQQASIWMHSEDQGTNLAFSCETFQVLIMLW